VTATRIGTGFDAHRLVDGRPLVLGGVRIAHPRGLEGHSDGDCLLHAVCDAILGALGAGDMGGHFPSTDARWKGASSLRFLESVARLADERGYGLGNLDATVIAQAKSTDGLGAIGRGEGIAAQAVVLLQRRD
jgi:2-C-methyl-D-erythritol 2,4-cyclodiphosphate synthase